MTLSDVMFSAVTLSDAVMFSAVTLSDVMISAMTLSDAVMIGAER